MLINLCGRRLLSEILRVAVFLNNGVFPKFFTEFSDKNICHYSKRARTRHTATSCVRDQNVNTAPARHM